MRALGYISLPQLDPMHIPRLVALGNKERNGPDESPPRTSCYTTRHHCGSALHRTWTRWENSPLWSTASSDASEGRRRCPICPTRSPSQSDHSQPVHQHSGGVTRVNARDRCINADTLGVAGGSLQTSKTTGVQNCFIRVVSCFACTLNAPAKGTHANTRRRVGWTA